LPEVLDFMSRALKAGHSLNMAFKMVGDELPAPASDEFRRVFDEINFGYSFQASLRRLSARIQSPDLSFLVIGLLIQRETGGNLADLLKKLADLGRERQKLRGQVKILAAEGKFSGILLGALPFLIGGAMTALNPTYMSILWTTEAGQNIVGLGLGMMVVGFVWMSRIVQIKV
jgi:tight adherence protein B